MSPSYEKEKAENKHPQTVLQKKQLRQENEDCASLQ